jgi:RNA polymerase sigma-70 factor (ECF subfamily)
VIFGERPERTAGDSAGTDTTPEAAMPTTTALASNPTAALAPIAPQPIGWTALTAHRPYLVAYARRRLMDPALAEDLVHDVFEAVVTGRAAFAGRSALRSWLVAILKHKIVDLIRERSGHDSLDSVTGFGEGDSDEHEPWALTCPRPRPDEVAEQRQRLAMTLARIQALPETLRAVVELRLLRDQDSASICHALAISEQNLFVRLHRARRLLAS